MFHDGRCLGVSVHHLLGWQVHLGSIVGNIFLSLERTIKVGDLGLSKRMTTAGGVLVIAIS